MLTLKSINVTLKQRGKMLTDSEILFAMDNAESAYDCLKMPKGRKKEFLLTFKENLSSGGILVDACPHCLGSGRAHKE